MFTMLFACMTCLAAVPGSDTVLDNFQYSETQKAIAAWKGSEETPPVQIANDDGRRVLRLQAPFADDTDLKRVVIDRSGTWNLAAPSFFTLQLRPESAAAFASITLYFHSKTGWYGQGKQLIDNQWHGFVFPKRDFRTEQQPVGWDTIDGIRIAFWRGSPSGGAENIWVDLGGLTAGWHSTAIIVPDGDGQETRAGRDAAERIEDLLQAGGVACDPLAESSLQKGSLGNRQVAILPYNPDLSNADYDVLSKWVETGGKLFACYGSAPQLMRLLHLKEPTYLRAAKPGALAAIRFDASDIPGLPDQVRQKSWNITIVKPAGPHARVIGHWVDESGHSTGHAALVISDTGAYFSHVVLADDQDAKQAMLMAVLGKLAPAVWTEAARTALKQADQIGDCSGSAELERQLKPNLTPASAQELNDANRLMEQARQFNAQNQGFDALAAARKARAQRVKVFLKAQPSPTVEGRAWWNHSGTGAYAGDWDRTCRELAKAGFNMVVPNMLWGGSARYESDVLPRSPVVEKYGDQIAQAVAAGKKYGIEVHVWKVNWNLGYEVPKEYTEQLRRAGRLQVTHDGKPMNWLNPAHPANFQLELDSLLEVVRKYDVDGIHFDYIRYPNGDCDFSDYSHHEFESDTGVTVKNWPDDCYSGTLKKTYTNWRCQQITRLVEAVHREAKKIRPNIKISAAVFGGYPGCRESVAQDWPLWIRNGYLDFVCPMDYTMSDEYFARLIESQKELVAGRIPIYPGIGATASRSSLSPDRVVGQIDITRRLKADGFTIFNLTESTAERILPAVAVGAGRVKAKPRHSERD